MTYTFRVAAGVFTGNITTVEQSLVAFNAGGSVTETVTPNVGMPTTFTLLSSSDNNFHTDDTPHSFNVDGATSFSIDFHLVNPSGNAIFTQIFRETNGATDTPFTVTGTVLTPEPSSIILCGLGRSGLFAAARRRKV